MRSSGILMHISSLPSPYGIGTMGRAAYDFVDFLEKAGQKLWQILPIHPTSYGDSPYQSFSVFAGNPYFIDLDMLKDESLLEKSDYANIKWGTKATYVDYATIYEHRFDVLRKAFEAFQKSMPKQYENFKKEKAYWLDDYALYMALKFKNGGKAWSLWDEEIKLRKNIEKYKKQLFEDIEYWKFIQFKFFEQWEKLKSYANKKGIKIIGDIPIYVAYDSVDVWVNPELFTLDENLDLVEVAGCPPDAFAVTGQLWGNPIYNWELMKKDGYSWWVKRMKATAEMYDVIRIDHFRGFDSYYSIPASHKTAEHGEWKQGPGIELFKTLNEKIGQKEIIAENLGFLTPSVHKLLEEAGYPGMKILQFGFDPAGDSEYLPHNYERNCVVYTGTHDNEPAEGWRKKASKEELRFCRKYLAMGNRNFSWEFIRGIWASVADMAIAQMQDFLGLDSRARMNVPSTIGTNWRWRAKKSDFTDSLALKIREMTKLYGR